MDVDPKIEIKVLQTIKIQFLAINVHYQYTKI